MHKQNELSSELYIVLKCYTTASAPVARRTQHSTFDVIHLAMVNKLFSRAVVVYKPSPSGAVHPRFIGQQHDS